MNIERLQGLIDLYIKAGKSRPAVLTMADYFLKQDLITQEEWDTLLIAIDAQDASQERIVLITEGMQAELNAATAQAAQYREALIQAGIDPDAV